MAVYKLQQKTGENTGSDVNLGKGPNTDDEFISFKECQQQIEAAQLHITIATCIFTLANSGQVVFTILLPATLPETSQQTHGDEQALQEFLINNDEMLPIFSSHSGAGEVFPALGLRGEWVVLFNQQSEEGISLDGAEFFTL